MLTASELADLAGCDEERVGRLVEAGYLAPVGERFSASDVPRIRLAEAFERAGITVEDIVRGIEGRGAPRRLVPRAPPGGSQGRGGAGVAPSGAAVLSTLARQTQLVFHGHKVMTGG